MKKNFAVVVFVVAAMLTCWGIGIKIGDHFARVEMNRTTHSQSEYPNDALEYSLSE